MGRRYEGVARMNVHTLKLHKNFYQAVKSGQKNFEVRRNDRGFQTGDVLVMRWFDPDAINESETYKPSEFQNIEAEVTYVLYGEMHGIRENCVVMGTKLIKDS